VKIARKSEPSNASDRVMVRYTRDFACVKRFQNFVFWGYQSISRSDIATISLDDRQPLHLIAEQKSWGKTESGYDFAYEVDIWSQIGKALFDLGKYAFFEHGDDSLYLGQIVVGSPYVEFYATHST